jgi:hypothetical protein
MNLQRLFCIVLSSCLLGLGLLSNAWAQAEQQLKVEPPLPPNMLNNPDSIDALEPTVTVYSEAEREVEEYRLRGRLFAMRVKVKQAPSYWLIDLDGSGRMVPGQGIGTSISMPQWVLKEF